MAGFRRCEEELADMEQYDCPQCGDATPELHEGYCRTCCESNQAALDRHNFEYDRWQEMTHEERDVVIKRASKMSASQ